MTHLARWADIRSVDLQARFTFELDCVEVEQDLVAFGHPCERLSSLRVLLALNKKLWTFGKPQDQEKSDRCNRHRVHIDISPVFADKLKVEARKHQSQAVYRPDNLSDNLGLLSGQELHNIDVPHENPRAEVKTNEEDNQVSHPLVGSHQQAC